MYAATIYSFAPGQGGSEGIPPGASKMDILVNKNGASTLQEALELRKREFAGGDLEQKILSEEVWTLAGGLQAARLHVSSRFGESVEVISALKGNTILLGGVGDFTLLDAIARTLRPLATTANDSTLYHFSEGKFSLQLPEGWQAFGPTTIVNDPARPFSLYTLGVDPLNAGGPGTSKVVIADAGIWTAEQFVASQCSTCPAHQYEETALAGKRALRTEVGGGGVPFMTTWYFVEHGDKLVALAIHDPETMEPYKDVVQSIRFE
jgi:hypothetical protein